MAEQLQYWFVRHGLTAKDIKICSDLIFSRYEDYTFAPVADQGGCSYTAIVHIAGAAERETVVLQFRLSDFAIDIPIAQDAERIFPKLAPKVIRCDLLALSNDVMLQVVEMSVVNGRKYSDVMSYNPILGQDEIWKSKNLLSDMADFFATSWNTGDSNLQRECVGLVGSSISVRLALLEMDLPSSDLRSIAKEARQCFQAGVLNILPVVLNHGDLLPCNIMVDAESHHLSGLVDWTEAEYLPFGMTLYGIEHLLGHMVDSQSRQTFVYHDRADMLRDFFWHSLRAKVGILRRDDLWQAVLLSRTIGILLWHGIAWNEGRRDRAVEAQSDSGELSCLEQMLGSTLSPRQFRL